MENLSYETLTKLKKEKINEWVKYLDDNNDGDWLWKQKNKVFSSKLPNILYSMGKLERDEIVVKQTQIVRLVERYINKLDKNKVYDMIKLIQSLDYNENINMKEINDMINNYSLDNETEEQEYAKELVENAEKIIKTMEQNIDNAQVNEQPRKINNKIPKVEIDKHEYARFKKLEQEYMDFKFVDFAIKLYSGSIIPIGHPNYNNDRIDIEIFGLEKYSININGEKYNIKNQQLFNKIKSFVSSNLDTLIKCSKAQNKLYLDTNSYEGGKSSEIKIKYGQLTIYINGQVKGNIGQFCEQFIDVVKKIIIEEGEKTNFHYFDEMIVKIKEQNKDDNDDEFTKYCKLYEEKFGKKAYIAEPGGTKDQTINAIKMCLEKNEDLLDSILYPNGDDNANNGVLY
ncbi:MAG: hypothetical protein IJO32_07925 [Bacilli bacterium]|nr:hypothetical protein [Bacilli bacterium]